LFRRSRLALALPSPRSDSSSGLLLSDLLKGLRYLAARRPSARSAAAPLVRAPIRCLVIQTPSKVLRGWEPNRIGVGEHSHLISADRSDHNLFSNWMHLSPNPQLPFGAAKTDGRPRDWDDRLPTSSTSLPSETLAATSKWVCQAHDYPAGNPRLPPDFFTR
jgi:hypothetical protein